MTYVNLFRIEQSVQGTLGILSTNNFYCYTLEPPWYNNIRQYSCIPQGLYNVIIRQSPKYGNIYWVTKVNKRSWILMHSGNYGGDIRKGYKTHTMGCLLLGKKKGFLGGQRAVLNSRITVRKFMRLMGNESFKLNIIGGRIC